MLSTIDFIRKKIVVVFQGTKLVIYSFINPIISKKNSIYLATVGIHMRMQLIFADCFGWTNTYRLFFVRSHSCHIVPGSLLAKDIQTVAYSFSNVCKRYNSTLVEVHLSCV
jgi:hypothetical protein